MNKNNILSILDLGSSKIRFTVFDSELKKIFSKSTIIYKNDDSKNYFQEIKKIVKIAEKEISVHIEDIILMLDSNKIFTINISLNKKIDKKFHINKIYDLVLLELNHLIKNNYLNYQIIHTVLDQCIVDNKTFQKLPIDKKGVNNIKVDFKLICLPKNMIINTNKNFNLSNINITNIFCTSYVKSLAYLNKLNLKKTSFLEIGFERSTIIFYQNNKLKFIKAIPVGSFHITKDISKIFKISIEDAEKVKNVFSQTETEFSYNNNSTNNISIKEIIDRNISIDLLKKVILYRIQEIIDLTFKKSEYEIGNTKDSELFLIGGGSNIFNNNSFYLNDNFQFKSIKYYEETDIEICSSALKYHLNNIQSREKLNKKTGLFEKFFNFFGK